MSKRELASHDELQRREALELVRETFPDTEAGFLLFAQTCINDLIIGNPDLNRVQADICKWLYGGHTYRMIQAQRGQAKTTLTAIYAVFKLIHNPRFRILIVSAGGKMSKEIASFIVQIIQGLDFLWMFVADRNAGDRASIEGYDIHWLFRGTEKSPSVKCLGVDSSIQGSRADIIIADDIESMKNARTVTTREILEELTKEFESVCATGDIIYLGTPQTTESIYNNLPARGYHIRIWTGRYPTVEEIENYSGYLAPMLLNDIKNNPALQTGSGMLGVSGQPTCPEMFDDETLITKEISQGKAKFQLQYMLNTKLMDAERYPLKIAKLIVADFNAVQGCVLPIGSSDDRNRVVMSELQAHKLFWAVQHEYDIRPFEQTIMYIDPAGGGKNGDETGYAIIKTLGSYIYIYDVGGTAGGYNHHDLMHMVHKAKEAGVNTVIIEQNFGHGSYKAMIQPIFNTEYPVNIEEEYVTGQKELRIIDVIEPVLSTNRLVIHPNVLKNDWISTHKYPTEKRATYTLLHQMALISRDKGCLPHDDRLDALSGAIRWVVADLDYDTQVIMDAKKNRESLEFIKNWSDPITRRKWMTGLDDVGRTNVFANPSINNRPNPNRINVFNK